VNTVNWSLCLLLGLVDHVNAKTASRTTDARRFANPCRNLGPSAEGLGGLSAGYRAEAIHRPCGDQIEVLSALGITQARPYRRTRCLRYLMKLTDSSTLVYKSPAAFRPALGKPA